jgi:hypothetical protein
LEHALEAESSGKQGKAANATEHMMHAIMRICRNPPGSKCLKELQPAKRPPIERREIHTVHNDRKIGGSHEEGE